MRARQAFDDARVFQVAEARRQQRARDAGQPSLDLVEAMAAEYELAHDERRPTIRQDLRRASDGTVLLVLLHGGMLARQVRPGQSKNRTDSIRS